MKVKDIVQSTRDYEKWVAKYITMNPHELEIKHKNMGINAFAFFRATYYRWVQSWASVVSDLAKAPEVLAVGDLHLENFGTWRDLEGRLIWGINDFDEAWPAPYTLDLVRLLASCKFAIDTENASVSMKKACEAIEQGYRDCYAVGGSPFVLAEDHKWLRLLALNNLRDPVRFWKKMAALPDFKGSLPPDVMRDIKEGLPQEGLVLDFRSRVAGLGSLGHQRIVAIAASPLWHGSHVIREAKNLAPAANLWVKNQEPKEIMSAKIIGKAIRILDPHVKFTQHWCVRRLAPDCSRIELVSLPEKRDEEKLLYYMGWETANIHLGSHASTKAVKKDLDKQKDHFLLKPSKAMAKAIEDDWKAWKSHVKLGQKKK